MNVLGLQYHDVDYFHDASAALYSNGIVSMYEEERFNKKKHSPCIFPYNSICKLLQDSKLKIDDIDLIVLPNKVSENTVSDIINSKFKCNITCKYLHCDHHLSHFLNSYRLSKFDSCVGIVIDADGDDYNSISIFDAEGNDIRCIKTFSTEQSLGQLYQTASEYCGFGLFGEGKMMGLASFGTSYNKYFLNWNNDIDDIEVLMFNDIKKKHDALVKSKTENKDLIRYLYDKPISSINNYLMQTFYPYKKCSYKDEIIYYKDLAATIQDNYNRILIKLVEYAKRMTNKENLVLSGGCIQNCTGNELIVKQNIFNHIFCSSVPHDGGISLGNALFGANNAEVRNQICFSNSVYELSDIDTKFKDKIEISDINISNVIDDLSTGKILGWFQNNAELGPRALGHRSIIANPSIRENLNVINYNIKHRDMFRPLAPIVLDSKFYDVFDTTSSDLCNYMLRTLTIRKEYRKKLAAVCHIDNTTRPQILSISDNNKLYSLIEQFYNKTGIPAIINTSFNDKDIPIVESLNDAIDMLLSSAYMSYVIFDGKIKIAKAS